MKKSIFTPGHKVDKWELIKIHSVGIRGGQIAWLVQCECGYQKIEKESNIKRQHSKQCVRCAKNISDKTDKKYIGVRCGKLTPIERISTPKGTIIYRCICDCGKHSNVRASNLRNGTISCGKCKYYNDITTSDWSRIRNGALKRNISFDITIEEAWELYETQNKKCALTGIPIFFGKTAKEVQNGKFTASLDRKNASIGYTKENCQWLHKTVNISKWKFDNQDFIDMCHVVSNQHASSNNNNWINYKQTSRKNRNDR